MIDTTITLDDKYTRETGRVLLSGTQALVRLPLMQRARDQAAGLDTRGFISGYRGSPMGNYDAALWDAGRTIQDAGIVFRPAVNEELAATACWGTQQVGLIDGARHDGVFAIWYGKGPGVSRAGDALKHGNFAGTSPHGGVLVLAGDDHAAKSSTSAHQSDPELAAALIPVLNPANVQDYLDLGLHGFALSRYSGLWVGFKCLTDTVESSATVDVGPDRVRIVLPEGTHPDWHIKRQFAPQADEASVYRWRLPAVQAYARANRLDRVTHDSPARTLGIVATGKSWTDLRQTFWALGLDEARLAALGIRVLKLALTWPVEADTLADFARGHREVLVIEEKRAFVEPQAARILYHLPADARPDLSGKTTPNGEPLLRSDGDLSPLDVAQALLHRLEAMGLLDAALQERAQKLKAAAVAPGNSPMLVRSPGFCSGCPHNTSTKIPDGSLAMAGIGCHTMAIWLPDRPTLPPTQMGGEGATWIGMAPFTDMPHMFQNLGDGTYFHSGLLAIRAAVAAGVNITYKILYNDAVAMTGGQPIDGPISVPLIVQQVLAESVARVVVVSDHPEAWAAGSLPAGVAVHHRDALDQVQRELREMPGTTVLVYVQTCAAEKRRRRKRGTLEDPAKRYVINEDVCEGCGDCSAQSNCVSLIPVETAFGRKRQIDQSSCNKDYSCVKGFCPSFVTVEGGKPKRGQAAAAETGPMPLPDLPAIDGTWNVLITGIGGTGVVTVGAVLAMAAHLEGKSCTALDLTGLSQKNGAVSSHLRIAEDASALSSARLGPGMTDMLIGCDLVVAASPESRATFRRGETIGVVNAHLVPTMLFQQEPDLALDTVPYRAALDASIGAGRTRFIEATATAARLLGDAIATNMFMVGAAWQSGGLPISAEAIRRAIELNGVAVAMNQRAFDWGRLAVADPVRLASLVAGPARALPRSLDEVVAHHADFLARYQSARFADSYRDFVERVRQAEAAVAPGRTTLSLTVARTLARLMAVKDEYEVARLYTDTGFLDRLRDSFDGAVKLSFNMAPPLLARRNKLTGLPDKQSYGPWLLRVLRVLARMRRLRGTALDVFGHTAERRLERALPGEFRALAERVLTGLSAANHADAVAVLAAYDRVRGYGHVKLRNLELARKDAARRMEAIQRPRVAAAA